MWDDFTAWLAAPTPTWLMLVLFFHLFWAMLGIRDAVGRVEKQADHIWAKLYERFFQKHFFDE